MIRSTVILFLLCLSVMCLSAQENYSLNANLFNPEKQPLPAGEASLLDSTGTKILQKANVLNGKFSMSEIPAGSYLLLIRSAGYKDRLEKIVVGESVNLSYTLDVAPAELEAVAITASKPPFTFKNGNIIANRDSPLFSSVADPVNLLSKIPGVQVSSNGENISVIGKGQPLIYINNLRSSLNDVKSLNVAEITSIELINNPSSRYEADARAVIQIRTRSNGREGIKGELAQTAAIRKYYLNRFAANASYRKKKVEWKSSMQFNYLETWEGNAFDFRIPERSIRSGYHVTAVTSRKPQMVGSAGVFYQVNEQDYVSANASVRSGMETYPIYTNSYLDDGNTYENVATTVYNRQPVHYLNGNVNFNKGFNKSNMNLFAGWQHTRLSRGVTSDVFNALNDNDAELSQVRQQQSAIVLHSGRVDLEKKWAAGTRLESGLSFSVADSKGSSSINTNRPPAELRNAYDYREYNAAAYSELAGKKKKIDWSAGVRAEFTNVTGLYIENETTQAVARKNISIFPKANVSYAVDSNTTATIRFTRSINRPGYSNANQTVVYINPYFEWANNINLDPSLYQEVSATFQYRKFSFHVGGYSHKGAVNSNVVYDRSRGVLTRTELNYDRETGIFLGANVPFRYKKWSSTNLLNFMYASLKDPVAVSGKTRPFVYMNTSNEFALPANFTVTASAWAVSKSYQGVFERNALFAVDTSVSKKIGKFTCAFRIDDVFASVNPKEKFAVNGVLADGMFFDNGREFSLSVRYHFGKLKESVFRNREVDENNRRVR